MMQFHEELGHVPWLELTHAYGSAADTPGHLLALLSHNREEREHALYELWGSICHQGSVYEASCAAIPFLIQILRDGPAEGRPAILSLLAGLAHRSWYANRNVRILHIARALPPKVMEPDRQEWWCSGEFLEMGNVFHDVRWMSRAHTLVAEGLADYLALLTCNDEATAQAALDLLTAFREAGETIVPAIVQRLKDAVGDEIAEADTLLSLAALLPDDAPLWNRYLIRLAPPAQSRQLVCYAAAVALARYRPVATPPEAVDVLLNAMLEPERLDERYEMLSGSGASVHVEACQLLSQLPAPHAVDALVAALDCGAARWRVLDTVRVAEAVLDAAFFGGWVQGRYWDHTIPKTTRATHESVVQQMLIGGDSRPYAERSYHHYGSMYHPGKSFTFQINCFGYITEEADRIRERMSSERGQGLTSDQRSALEALLRCAPLWEVRHNLFEIYGLPATRENLEALLRGEPGMESASYG